MVTVVNLVPQLANQNPCIQYLGRGLVPVKLGLIILLIQFAANYHARFMDILARVHVTILLTMA